MKLLTITIFILISIIASHRLLPNSFLTTWLFTSNPHALEVELIGSGFLGLIIGLLLMNIQDRISEEQNKKRSIRFFRKIILPELKNAFDRNPSSINTMSAMNSKAFFDNSSINNLHDVIEKYLYSIHEYIDYVNEEKLANLLIKYYESVEEGYRRGEEFDDLLRKMSSIVEILPYSDPEYIIYLKAVRYSEVDDKEIQILLKTPRIRQFYDFYEKNYKDPKSDLKLQYKNQFIQLDAKMLEKIKTLKSDCEVIRSIITKI